MANKSLQCIVKNCSGKTSGEIKLFRIPNVCTEEWCENLRIHPGRLEHFTRVCSRHFEPECIGARRLKKGALPTLCLAHNGEVLQPLLTSSWRLRERKCCVPLCNSIGPLSSLHRIPAEKRDLWLARCDALQASNQRDLRICSKHFHPSMIGKAKLLKNALPYQVSIGDGENNMALIVNDEKYPNKEEET